MTVGIIQAHADPILALLRAAPPATPFEALTVYDGEVPDYLPGGGGGPVDLYCLVYMNLTTPFGTALTNASDRGILSIITHSVSGNATTNGSADSVRIVAQRVRAALLDIVPTVAGRSCFPIRQDPSGPVRRDEKAGPKVYDQIDLWRLETVPG